MEAYSSVGRTVVVYAVAFTGYLQPFRLRCRKPRVLLALDLTLPMWSSHFRWLLIVTPRYLLLLTASSVWPCRVYWWLMVFLLLVTWITVHFCGWNSICHSRSHLASDDRSFCSAAESSLLLMCLYIKASSAKSLTSDEVYSGRSLMNVRNRRGPITVPCGTPDMTSAHEEVYPSSVTLCVL